MTVSVRGDLWARLRGVTEMDPFRGDGLWSRLSVLTGPGPVNRMGREGSGSGSGSG